MRIRLLQEWCDISTGVIIDRPEGEARHLPHNGIAELVTDQQPETAAAEPVTERATRPRGRPRKASV